MMASRISLERRGPVRAIATMTPLDGMRGSVPRTLELGGMLTRLGSLSLPYQIATAGVFLVAYVALEWISFIHEYKGVPVTPWNPGLGVVFALMVLGGPRYGVVLFAGVVIAETTVLQTKLQWPIILGIAAIFATVYGTVAAVARKHLRLDVGLYRLRDVVILLVAGISGAILAALLLSLLLQLNAQLELSDVLVTPPPLPPVSGSRPLSIGRLRYLVPELLLYAVLVAASLWIIGGAQTGDGFKFFYLLFLPVMVAAVRYGLDGACVGLALTQFGLVGIMHLYGFDARTFTEFQILMLVLTATGLIVGVVVSERQNADRLVKEAEARLKEKETEAAEAARYNLVSGMASALAHEINQPMTAARALARSAQHILGTPDPDLPRAVSNLTTLIAHIDHAGSVVGHMRDF